MKNTIALTVEYDGSEYVGYQIQPGTNTVQYQLERSLQSAYGLRISTVAAGRTDTGVHALGQVISYIPVGNNLPVAKLPQILHQFLPKDIRIRSARVESEMFHARYSAKVRMYRYLLLQNDHNRYGWNSKISLNVDHMQKYLAPLVGYFDFSGLSCTKEQETNTKREIFAIDVLSEKEGIYVDIYGNAFLKSMVRIIVGECIYAIRKKKDFDYLYGKVMYPHRNKKVQKFLAPSRGLTLHSVYYTKIFGERSYYRVDKKSM